MDRIAHVFRLDLEGSRDRRWVLFSVVVVRSRARLARYGPHDESGRPVDVSLVGFSSARGCSLKLLLAKPCQVRLCHSSLSCPRLLTQLTTPGSILGAARGWRRPSGSPLIRQGRCSDACKKTCRLDRRPETDDGPQYLQTFPRTTSSGAHSHTHNPHPRSLTEAWRRGTWGRLWRTACWR